MRAHIAKIPDGVYTGEAFVDSDGVDPDPLTIRLTLQKEGTRPPLRLLASRARHAAARSTA